MENISPIEKPKISYFRRLLPSKLLLLLVILLIVGAIVWSWHAPRFFSYGEASYREHWVNAGWILTHVLGGSVALISGLFLLWTGLRRQFMRFHRWTGRVYLIGGGTGVLAGMVLSVFATHEPRSLYVSTFVLGVFWFAAAFMAYRAIRNRRIDAHQEWVIRSYVLTFTFIICRIAMKTPELVSTFGVEAITTVVWVSWTIPLFLTEILLQWKNTSPKMQK